MKTTIDIPKNELEDAIRFSGAATKQVAVLVALADFNRRKRMAALVKHAGSSEYGRKLVSSRIGPGRQERPFRRRMC